MAAATSHQIVSSSTPNGVNAGAAVQSSTAATPSSSTQQAASHSTSNSSSNVVGGNFKVGRKIGEGSFGVCFEGEDLQFRFGSPARTEIPRSPPRLVCAVVAGRTWLVEYAKLISHRILPRHRCQFAQQPDCRH